MFVKRFLRSRKGLSTVVTTLIILVVSVLLATVVTFYAINVATTRVQQESLQVFKQHVWHNGTNFGEAAFLIINTGGRDVVIDKIAVRSQECAWATVWYNKSQDTLSDDLPYVTPNADSTLPTSVTVGSASYALAQGAAGNDLILKSGYSMIIYIVNPDHISSIDIGVSVGINVFTANAQYYKECNVEASI
jgi:Flp pilus assembly protein TadG